MLTKEDSFEMCLPLSKLKTKIYIGPLESPPLISCKICLQLFQNNYSLHDLIQFCLDYKYEIYIYI